MLKTDRKSAGDEVVITFVQPSDTPPMSVVGSFNGWDPMAHPLRKRSNGTRSVKVTVPGGERLTFRYLLDGGQWMTEDDVETDGDGNNVLET